MPYGAHQAEIQAQQAVPLANVPAPNVTPPAAPAAPAAMPPQGMPSNPVQLGDFTRPTERPTEPITAGLPMGPGPGPEALSSVTQPADEIGAQLRAVFGMYPNDDLLRVLAAHDQGH